MTDHTHQYRPAQQSWLRLLPGLLLTLLLTFAPSVFAEVYKTVDENGNVTYTDQPPTPDAKPVKLRELSVISPVRSPKKEVVEEESVAEGQIEVTSLKDLKRGYKDFAITNPTPDQTLWGTQNQATITWDSRYRLQPGMQIMVYIDGVAQEPSTGNAMIVEKLWRGQHEVYADLVDARNRRIARTETVTFHIKQFSANFNKNRAQGG